MEEWVYYDFYLILPTYHALRNRLKLNYADLDEHHFFDPEHRRQNVYNMFKNIYLDKLHQKRQHQQTYIV
jgi:hypothetical protein